MRKLILLLMGILFMISSTFGQNFFGNREEPKITETDFKTLLDGFWEGEGNQLGSKWSMQLYYDARIKYFVVQYPSLSCSGHWEIAKISSKVLALKESITQGTGNCKKNSEVKVRFVSEKEMKIEFYEVNGLIPLATAKIYKKEPLQIENTVFKTLLTEVWEGEVNQIDSKWLIQLQYNSQKDEFTVNYPTLSCSGTWNVNTVTENMIKLNEVITEGGNNCIKEMDIYIYYNNDNTLNVKFHRTDASQHIASGTIQKKDQFAETESHENSTVFTVKKDNVINLIHGNVKEIVETHTISGKKVQDIFRFNEYQQLVYAKIGRNKWTFEYNEIGKLEKSTYVEGKNDDIPVEFGYTDVSINEQPFRRDIFLQRDYCDEKIELFFYTNSGNLEKSITTTIDNKQGYNTGITESYYNAKGKLIKKIDKKGNDTYEYLYNTEGECISEKLNGKELPSFGDNYGEEYYEPTLKYDTKGRVIAYIGDGNGEQYTYNENGFLSLITSYSRYVGDAIISYTGYEYDSQKNWTKRTVNKQNNDLYGEIPLVIISTRTITYYE